MPENNKTEEFLQKLAPCIERGELEACVEEAARVAREMGIGAEELFDLSLEEGGNGRYDFAYVLALGSAKGLEGIKKAGAYCNAGVAAQYLGKSGEAEKQYKQAIVADPNDAKVHSNYAILLKELKRYEEAEEQNKQAIAADPKRATAHYNYAIMLQELKRYEEAEEQYKQAVATDPKFAIAYLNYAIMLQKLKRYEEAEEQNKQAITADPKDAKVHYNYANLLTELKKYEEAEEQYKIAIFADPKYAATHSNYAILLNKLKRYEEAEEQYKQAITADTKLAEAHSNYALLLQELKRYEEAEEQYKLAIAAYPKFGTAHYNYANLLQELKKNEEAEEQYKLAIAADPKDEAAHSNYANLLKELKRYEEAEEQYKQVIATDQKLVIPHFSYANLLKELKRYEEAEEQYKLAIATDSKYAAANYNYANLLRELKRYEEAEEQYKLAIASDPKLAEAHSNYANLLSELKRYEEAEEQYKLAIAADPILAAVHGAYGLLLIDMDRREKAQDETEKASTLFSESGRITNSHLAWAWFHEQYSEKYFKMRKFPESGQDAGKAGDEYLKAAETVDSALKDHFSQRGNILKAKSYIRKVPKKHWYTNILYRLGRKRNIPGIINNLKQAASYYEKAAMCPIEERQNVCSACHISISVFSDTLSAMEAVINKRSPEINKKEWITKLDGARQIYKENGMENGVALVDTLKQLIQCIDEMAVFREGGLGIQKEKCGRCFGELTKVSENLDGALNVLAEHSIEAIRDYAKKQGMGGFVSEEKRKSLLDFLITAGKIIGFIIALIVGIIAILQFLQIDTRALDFIKNIFNQTQP
ncbi:MAG: tetratricopeptide repeat protein [Candidatus Methanoperedens sp.]